MKYKRVDREHFETFIKARLAEPEPKAQPIKSYGQRVHRLYYTASGERVAYLQMNRNGDTTYHINLAA